MDDAQRWLAVAADVLNEPDPLNAEELLVVALRRWGHAYLTVRTETSPAPQPEEVEFFPGPAWRDSPAWASVVHDAAFDQPLYAYNVSTRTDQPATLEGVLAQGWGLSERAVHLMEQLGFTRHQMTIPLALNHHGARDAYALVSESPYTDLDLARAAAIQALVAGLDSHIRHLAAAARLACAAPDPMAVHLTPRERVMLDHIARGATVDGIAARLRISRRTVHKHQEHLYRKLGAVDRLSAVLSAQRLGLVKAPER
jgi:ATP/maltotriose-dependent transcriptional regulator MalT